MRAAFEWATHVGDWRSWFDAVILLKLRRAKDCKSLAEVILKCFPNSDTQWQRDVERFVSWCGAHKERVLWALDGWDEIALYDDGSELQHVRENSQPSIVVNLLAGSRVETAVSMAGARVVDVASLDDVDSQLMFAAKRIPKTDEEAKHIQKLSRQSDLFDQIVKKSLKRLANRMQFKHDQAEDRCVNVRKLLGKLAWESFVAGSSCVDWTSFEKKHEEIASCGLVEKVDYEWVHKSVQEYLAAEHVCVHLDLKKKKIGKKLKQLRSKMEERSDLFFGFVCGLGGKPFKYLDRWFPSDFGSKRENGNLVSVGPLLWIEETRNNDWERLKMFLSEHWKDVMASFGGLLLRGAANHGTVKAMNFLLEYCQSQIDEKDAMDYSALHLAVCAGHFEIARLLVIAGAEVNSADKDQWTILWSAFHQEQKAIALLLLEYGADVKTSDEVPSLMHFAAYYGWADLVPSLKCKGVDVNGVYGDLARPLHWAATQGKLDCVKALIQEGADASARDGGSCTPLMNAAFAGHFNVVEYLAPQLCSDLSEALWWACRSDNFSSVEVVDLLIRNGADLNASDIIHGWTALFFAAKSGCGAVVDLLIKLGADVNHVDLRGRSYTYFLQAHDNRYCDICRESIFGKRFASLERTDYDECEFCHNGETQEKFELKIL